MVEKEKLARLRPGDPAQALRAAFGEKWKEPNRHAEGHVFQDDFTARLTTDDRIGEITFRFPFPLKEPVGEIAIGDNSSSFEAFYPLSESVPDDREAYGWSFRRTRLQDDLEFTVGIKSDQIRILTLSDPKAVYPERPYKYADASLTEAFDLELSSPVRLETRPEDGWCFGRPPAIGPDRWPISSVHGTPLRHAFTLKLPEQYRTQGSELVAVCLFIDEMFEKIETSPLSPLTTFREADARRFDMEWWGFQLSLFWLTTEEFKGPLGAPPMLGGQPRQPGWLRRPPIDYFGQDSLPSTALDQAKQRDYMPGGYDLQRLLEAERPRSGWATLPASEALEFGFPIRIFRREGDPNVGRAAREMKHQNAFSGYVPAYAEESNGLDLERFAEFDAHLGGTMFPAQGYPNFSPFYLEFQETFGGFAFGGGMAQLDLEQMQVEWAG